MTVFDNVKVGDYIPEDAFPDLDGPDVCDYWDTQAKYGCVRLTGHAGPHMDTYDDSDGLPPRMREVAWLSTPQHAALADGTVLRDLTVIELAGAYWDRVSREALVFVASDEGTFYEEDEPVEDVLAAFNAGEKGVTGNACGTGGN